MKCNLIIITKPNFETNIDTHYLIRSNDTDDITMIGDVCINGSIISISKSYDDIRQIYKNLNY